MQYAYNPDPQGIVFIDPHLMFHSHNVQHSLHYDVVRCEREPGCNSARDISQLSAAPEILINCTHESTQIRVSMAQHSIRFSTRFLKLADHIKFSIWPFAMLWQCMYQFAVWLMHGPRCIPRKRRLNRLHGYPLQKTVVFQALSNLTWSFHPWQQEDAKSLQKPFSYPRVEPQNRKHHQGETEGPKAEVLQPYCN